MQRTRVSEQEFGRHVRRLRHGRGLTQEALAAQCTLSVDAIRRVEHGGFSPTLETVRKLARGLDVSLRTLFQGFERRRRKLLDELCDFLSTRPEREVSMAWQVIRALLRKNPSRGETG
jgi:transcriptional regulator with XRE-family HTH domain